MKKKYIKNCAFKVLLIMLCHPIIFQSVIAQNKIPCSVISNGGGKQVNTSYILNGTVGEPAIGKSNNSLNQNLHGFWNSFYYSTVVDVNEDDMLPIEFKLHQNYPNPFNPSTVIKYAIPERSYVLIKVYNIAGEELVTLVNVEKDQGWYELNFNPRGLSSGVYIFRMNAGNFVSTKKMMLIK